MFLREAAGAEVDAGVAAVAAAGGTEGDCATASGTREALRARDWGLCMVLLAAETAEPPRLGSLRAAIVFFGREGGGKRGMRLAGVEVPRGMQRKKNCAPSLTRPRHLCHCDPDVSSPLGAAPPPPQQEEERPTGALLLLSSSLARALASFRRVSSREFELRLRLPPRAARAPSRAERERRAQRARSLRPNEGLNCSLASLKRITVLPACRAPAFPKLYSPQESWISSIVARSLLIESEPFDGPQRPHKRDENRTKNKTAR